MYVTKYPQSCLKVEANGRALLFDLGRPAAANKARDFGKCDAVIYTHRHADHLDVGAARELHKSGVQLYGNDDVAEVVGGGVVEVVHDDEELVIAGFRLRSLALPHCQMVNGTEGVPNNGYLINDQLLLPGDSTDLAGITARYVAMPIFGPDISLHDAYKAAIQVKAELVIPVHYDIAEMNPEVFNLLAGQYDPPFQIKPLQNGERLKLESTTA